MDENNFNNQMGFQQQWNNPNFYQGNPPGGVGHGVYQQGVGGMLPPHGGMQHSGMHQPGGAGVQYGGALQYGGMMPQHGGGMFPHVGGMPQQEWPNHHPNFVGGNPNNPNAYMNNQNFGWNNQNFPQQNQGNATYGNVAGHQEQYDLPNDTNTGEKSINSEENDSHNQDDGGQSSKDDLDKRKSRDGETGRRRERRKREGRDRSPPRRDDRGPPSRRDDRDRSPSRRSDKERERDRSPRRDRDKRRDSPDRHERRRREERRRDDHESDHQRDSRHGTLNMKPTNTIMLKSLHPSIDERDDEVHSLKSKIPGMTYYSSYSTVTMSARDPVCIGCGDPLPNSSVDKHNKCPLCRPCGQASPCEVCVRWPADMFQAIRTWKRSRAAHKSKDASSSRYSSPKASRPKQKQQLNSDLVKLVTDQVAGEVTRLTEQAIASLCQTQNPIVSPNQVPSVAPILFNPMAPPAPLPSLDPMIPANLGHSLMEPDMQNPDLLHHLVSRVMPTVLDYLGIPYKTTSGQPVDHEARTGPIYPIIPIHASLIERLDKLAKDPPLKPAPRRLASAFPLPDSQFRSTIIAPPISKEVKDRLRADQGLPLKSHKVFKEPLRSAYEEVLIVADRAAREGIRAVNVSGFLLSFLSSPNAPKEVIPGAFSLLRECIRLISDQLAAIVLRAGKARRKNVLHATSIPQKYFDLFSKSATYSAKDLFFGKFAKISSKLPSMPDSHLKLANSSSSGQTSFGPSRLLNNVKTNTQTRANLLKPSDRQSQQKSMSGNRMGQKDLFGKNAEMLSKLSSMPDSHLKLANSSSSGQTRFGPSRLLNNVKTNTKTRAKSSKSSYRKSRSFNRMSQEKRRRRQARLVNFQTQAKAKLVILQTKAKEKHSTSTAPHPLPPVPRDPPTIIPDLMSVAVPHQHKSDKRPISPHDDWVRRGRPRSPRDDLVWIGPPISSRGDDRRRHGRPRSPRDELVWIGPPISPRDDRMLHGCPGSPRDDLVWIGPPRSPPPPIDDWGRAGRYP